MSQEDRKLDLLRPPYGESSKPEASGVSVFTSFVRKNEYIIAVSAIPLQIYFYFYMRRRHPNQALLMLATAAWLSLSLIIDNPFHRT